MTNVVGTYHVRRYNGTLTDSASGQTRATEPGSAGALAFVKGIGSSGDTGTIDDNYRSIWPYQTPFALNHSSNGMTEFLHIETYIYDKLHRDCNCTRWYFVTYLLGARSSSHSHLCLRVRLKIISNS